MGVMASVVGFIDHLPLLLSLIHLSVSQTDYPGKITCYSWTDNAFPNNTQCPGSRTCCQVASECLPNRLCTGSLGELIVPACSVWPWDSTCSQICQYDPETGFLPRAVNCTDGSFCCSNDPTCCAENRGIVLNGLGDIVSTDGGLTSTVSSTSTYSSSLLPSTTSSAPTTALPSSLTGSALVTATGNPDSSPPSNLGLSTGAKIGIGFGAAFLVVMLLTLAYLIWLHRSRSSRIEKDKPSSPMDPVYPYHQSYPSELYTDNAGLTQYRPPGYGNQPSTANNYNSTKSGPAYAYEAPDTQMSLPYPGPYEMSAGRATPQL